MRKHFVKVAFVVSGSEVLNIDRVSDPVERGSLAQHGTAAAVDEAANQLLPGIVVGRFGILSHVKACKAPCALDVFCVLGNRESQTTKNAQAFAMMHPVRLSAEYLVVHSAAARGNLCGLRLRVLA